MYISISEDSLGKAMDWLERCLTTMKSALYPAPRTGRIGFVESKFVQSLLWSLCARLKIERGNKVPLGVLTFV